MYEHTHIRARVHTPQTHTFAAAALAAVEALTATEAHTAFAHAAVATVAAAEAHAAAATTEAHAAFASMMGRKEKLDVVILLPCGRIREPRVRALKVVLLPSATVVAMAEAHAAAATHAASAAVTGVKLDVAALLPCGRVREPRVRALKVLLPSAVHVGAVFVVVVVHLLVLRGAHIRVVKMAVSNR